MGPHSFLLAPKATPVCAARLNEANRALEDTLNNILERLVTPVAPARRGFSALRTFWEHPARSGALHVTGGADSAGFLSAASGRPRLRPRSASLTPSPAPSRGGGVSGSGSGSGVPGRPRLHSTLQGACTPKLQLHRRQQCPQRTAGTLFPPAGCSQPT
jgi:hypothetical protein